MSLLSVFSPITSYRVQVVSSDVRGSFSPGVRLQYRRLRKELPMLSGFDLLLQRIKQSRGLCFPPPSAGCTSLPCLAASSQSLSLC